MICPYIVHRVTVVQNTSKIDEQDRETEWAQWQANYAKAMDCKKGECAAWQGGKCCYRGE